jgi:hypothetical protein
MTGLLASFSSSAFLLLPSLASIRSNQSQSIFLLITLPVISLLIILLPARFVAGMIDSMNAEIALGTITNANEAVQWMGYTYLFSLSLFLLFSPRLDLDLVS